MKKRKTAKTLWGVVLAVSLAATETCAASGASTQAAVTTATVRNQAQLDAALKNSKITSVVIKTNKVLSLKIKAGDYNEKKLVIASPKSTINNYGNFKKISIHDGKIFYDRGLSNQVCISDPNDLKLVAGKQSVETNVKIISSKARITIVNNGQIDDIQVGGGSDVTVRGNATEAPRVSVSADADITVPAGTMVGTILIDRENARVALNIDGSAETVVISEKADVTIAGDTKDTVKVENNAEGSRITAEVKTEVCLNAYAAIVLEKGAEGSSVIKGTDAVRADVANNTASQVIVMDSSGAKSSISAGATIADATPVTGAAGGESENGGESEGNSSSQASNSSESTSSSASGGLFGNGSSIGSSSSSGDKSSSGAAETKTQYTVTYDSKGGSKVEPETVQAGGSFTKPDDPTQESCQFLGWYEKTEGEPDGETKYTSFGTPTDRDLQLYAKWAVDVVFEAGESVASVEKQTVELNGKAEEPAAPIRQTYIFKGWTTDETKNHVWSDEAKCFDFAKDTVAGPLTLYALWTPAKIVVTAGEGEGSYYETFAQAIAAVRQESESVTMTLRDDVTLGEGEAIEFTGRMPAVTLDLNGKKVTDHNADQNTIKVGTGVTLTIQGNGTVERQSVTNAAILNQGTLIVKNGTFTGGETTLLNDYNKKLTIKNGTFTNSVRNVIVNRGTTEIVDGSFTQTCQEDNIVVVKNEMGTLTIRTGTFSGGYYAVRDTTGVDMTSNIRIESGTFSSYYGAVRSDTAGSSVITIFDGTFEGTSDQADYSASVMDRSKSRSIIEIQGGTFKSELEGAGNSTIKIQDGYFFALRKGDGAESSFKITSGYFQKRAGSYISVDINDCIADEENYELKEDVNYKKDGLTYHFQIASKGE